MVKSPDAIAIKAAKVVAIEVLQKYYSRRKNPVTARKHGKMSLKFTRGWTLKGKRQAYHMFDDVIFTFYNK